MSMTDEQIVKGLECCVSHKGCDACEFYMHDTCFVVRHKEIFALIKRQQAEIERLQKESADKERAYTDEFCCRKEWQRKCRDLLEEKTEVKCKAVREFAEKYKTEVTNRYEDIAYKDLFFGVIDNLVKEMTEKEGGMG